MTVTPILAPAFLQLGVLSDEEEQTRQRLLGQLRTAQRINARQESFYEGSKRLRDLGIAIPPHLRDVEAVAAWPEIVVDVIDERMDWRGWRSAGDDFGLADVFTQNRLEIEVGQATLDALISGLSYLSCGTGDEGEPEVLVKAESPSRMTATWDPRLRHTIEALAENYTASGRVEGWTTYLPNQTIRTERQDGRLVVVERDEHDRGRVPISVLRNRPRASRTNGRSEITRAVRSLTESGMRTLLGMEIAREFYGAPQRFLMGADESMFVDENGNRKTQWDAVLGKMLMIPRDDNGEVPEAPGQFSQASPQPFTEILKTLAQMLSAATGIPATHLGFTTDNPASADAIDRADKRLTKRSVRRQRQYDEGLIDLGELCVLWRDGNLPPQGAVRSLWVDPEAPGPEAAASRASQMVDKGVLDPTWDFTLEQYGLSDEEILRVRQERLRSSGRRVASDLAAAAAAARQDPAVAALAGDTPADGTAA